jgi:hypothetical protein
VTDHNRPDALDAEALDQEQPAWRSPGEDASTRRGLPSRLILVGAVASLIGGAVGAIVGYAVSGLGLAVGLGVAFALVSGVLAGFVPAESEDGSVATSVNEGPTDGP